MDRVFASLPPYIFPEPEQPPLSLYVVPKFTSCSSGSLRKLTFFHFFFYQKLKPRSKRLEPLSPFFFLLAVFMTLHPLSGRLLYSFVPVLHFCVRSVRSKVVSSFFWTPWNPPLNFRLIIGLLRNGYRFPFLGGRYFSGSAPVFFFGFLSVIYRLPP